MNEQLRGIGEGLCYLQTGCLAQFLPVFRREMVFFDR